jgi:DNA-binding NtrC family response regulator
MQALQGYAWPGNVRELQNVMERVVVLGSGELILPEDLPDNILELASADAASSYHSALHDLKCQLIADALEKSRGSYVEAARLLGLHPNYLHRLIKNLGLRKKLSPKLSA